jgi:hypothetical protein
MVVPLQAMRIARNPDDATAAGRLWRSVDLPAQPAHLI